MTYREYFGALVRHLPIVFLTALLCGALAFSVTAFFMPQTYRASCVLCIRNQHDYENGISGTDLVASESLVDSCIALLKGVHDAENGELAFEKLGAGVFRMTLAGEGEQNTASALTMLSEWAETSLPKSLHFASLTLAAPIMVEPLARQTLRNTVLAAVSGVMICALGILLAETHKHKKKHTI